MTHFTDATMNALANIAYAYAVELNEAAIHADHDELEQLVRQITNKLKARLRVELEEHQAAVLAVDAAQVPAAWISNETLNALELHRSQDFPAGGHVLALQRGNATVPLYTHLTPRQAAPAAAAVHSGWRLVPVEPTAAMRRAAQRASMDHSEHEDWLYEDWPDFFRVWNAMLAAVPQPQGEPNWDDVISQAETATGLPVERHTFSIIQREIRRWLSAQGQGGRAA